MVEKPNINLVREEVSIVESEYGIKITPTRRRPRQSSKLDKSKSRRKENDGKKLQQNRSRSVKKLRSQSGRKKTNH